MPGMPATMREYGRGSLHSGSKSGPKVTSRKQAVAIGMSQERKMKRESPRQMRRGR